MKTFTIPILRENWKSGLTVALISIPLSISLAVASGVSPVVGIITAIWAGLIGAILGGSNYNIIGPTGALSGVIASYALMYGPENTPLLAILSGLFIIVAYVCRLEHYFIFVPSSVIHGFTLGIACIIALSQINFAFGLSNIPQHKIFIENIIESFKHIGQSSWPILILFGLFFFALLVLRRIIPTIPGPIIISPFGIALGYAATHGMLPFSIETLGTKFGILSFQIIQMHPWGVGKYLINPSLVIAFIAVIETMLSAKIADTMTKTKHNARKEILGLGLANIVSGIMGGIPATAALARTALNIKTGANSYLSAFLSSIFIALGSMLFLGYFAFMPMAVIAAILVFVAINMVEREHFERLFFHDKQNFFIALLVAALTVYEDPITGILVGIVVALLLLVHTIAQSFHEVKIHEEILAHGNQKNILTYTFKGKLVYLNSQAHILRFESDFEHYAVVILALADVYFVDLDGVDMLNDIIEILQKRGQMILITGVNPYLKNMLASSNKFKELEQAGLVFDSTQSALSWLKRF